MNPTLPVENNLPLNNELEVNQIKEKKSKKIRHYISTAVFVLSMLADAWIARSVGQPFEGSLLIGSVVISMALSIVFYIVAWIIHLISRKFGNTVGIVLWILICLGLVYVAYSFYKAQELAVANNPFALQKMDNVPNEDGLVLPPGTNLSEFPAYLQIDKSKVVFLNPSNPNGGMIIPKSAIKFVMSYNDCLANTDMSAQKLCAEKYAIEKNDVRLCKSMIHSTEPEAVEYISNLQDECTSLYAAIHKDVSICDTEIKNKFIADSNCFGGIISQIKTVNECSTVFKKDADIKDCVKQVEQNQSKPSSSTY